MRWTAGPCHLTWRASPCRQNHGSSRTRPSTVLPIHSSTTERNSGIELAHWSSKWSNRRAKEFWNPTVPIVEARQMIFADIGSNTFVGTPDNRTKTLVMSHRTPNVGLKSDNWTGLSPPQLDTTRRQYSMPHSSCRVNSGVKLETQFGRSLPMSRAVARRHETICRAWREFGIVICKSCGIAIETCTPDHKRSRV